MRRIIDSLLLNRKSFQIRAEGISMAPLLESGDILYLKKVPFSKVIVNDLLMVKKGKNVFTHRVIYRAQSFIGFPSYLITKGDNNLGSDGRIYPHQIIGKVYQIKRNGRIFNLEDYYLVQSSQYFREIVKIKQAFENEGIDFLFLKGLPLHLYFEKSHPKRLYADCDLLVDKESSSRAERIFNRFKYTKEYLNIFSPGKPLKKATELNFYKKINDLLILFDVHLEFSFLVNRYGKIDMLYPQKLIDKLTIQALNEKQYVKVFNNSFPILSPSNLIIFLSLHFFHHNYKGVGRLQFLAIVVKRYMKNQRVCEEEMIEKIIFYNLQNFIYPVFLLLSRYYGVQLPKRTIDSIKPGEGKLKYIKKIVLKVKIFNDETNFVAGMNRFKNLFSLSSYPFPKKLLIIFNREVIYSFFKVIIFFLRRSFNKAFRSS